MKSLAELAAIKARMQNNVLIREGAANTRVVVGMATCGIADQNVILHSCFDCSKFR